MHNIISNVEFGFIQAMNQSMEVDFGRAPEKKSKGRQHLRFG